MRTSFLACLASSLLILAAASAELSLNERMVFAGDDFTVSYKLPAPVSTQTVKISFEGQEHELSVPSQSSGTFSANVTFKAPDKPGDYEVKVKAETLKVVVEKPLLVLENLALDKSEVAPGETATLKFTVRNSGEYMVYNVNYRLVLAHSPSEYEFESSPQLIGNMKSGEQKEITETVRAKSIAYGSTTVQAVAEYEFDQEKHYQKGEASLAVKNNDWIDWAILILFAIAVVIVLVEIVIWLSTRKKKS